MKKQKAGIGFLAVVGGLVGVWWIYRHAKKTYRELERREEENREILSKTGMSEEEADKISVSSAMQNISAPQEKTKITESEKTSEDSDYDINLVKKLFTWARFDSDIPVECMDIDEISSEERENIVHFIQRYDPKKGRNMLDLLFELPTSALPDVKEGGKARRRHADGMTCVGDFMKTLRGKFDEETGILKKSEVILDWEKMVRDEKNVGFKIKSSIGADVNLEGYFFLEYEEFIDDEWKTCTKMVKILPEFYKNNKLNPNHTRVTDYVCDIKDYYEDKEVDNLPISSATDNIRNIEILGAMIAIRVTFPMQDTMHIDGINFESAKEILRDIYYKLEVKGSGDGSFKYEYYLFHNPNFDEVEEVYCTEKDQNGKLAVKVADYF